MSASTYRLPSHVSPRRYDIQLNAQLGREEFDGKVTIAIDLCEEKDTIDLHARDLVIARADLMIDGESQPAEVRLDPDNERIVLQFSQAFRVGEASLILAFTGRVSQTLRGLYLAQDRPEQALCTQCEATDARAIFPCFDEPTFKAQFAFEITTSPDAIVLANGSLLSITDNNTTKTWRFAPTKIMSSYLVAFVIGDLAATAEQICHGIPLRVWALRGKEQFGAFAVEYTAKLLPWYEDYFGVGYHYDKYDQVAVPGFAAGAMENSGLVVFRQELLIMDPQNSSWKQEKSVAHVIAHEFAHMWFGNLVTMQWWDDLWLNEAFAEWVSYRVVAEISPEYKVWDDFQGSNNYALGADALENTHPIYSPVQTPSQAMELFDVITYFKGCAVLRMLENFLGSDAFCNGLRTYMQEFTERNARGSDLWRHLQGASQQPVTQIMESWILLSGHPCVTVTYETMGGQHQLRLSQKRFLSNPRAVQDHQQLWQVPMVIRYADDTGIHVIRHLLAAANELLILPVTGDLRWCYPNAEQIGFYRQNLTETLLTKILGHLDQLTPSEQMGLLGDQWELTRSGHQSISQFLEVLAAMASQCDNYNLLSAIVEHLQTLEQMVEDIQDISVLERFRGWVSSLFRAPLEDLGFEPRSGESNEVSQRRIPVVKAMTALAHDPKAVAQVRALAASEATNPQSVDANLATTIVAVDAQFGNSETFKKHVDVYQARKASAAPPQTVTRYVYTFYAFRAPELVTQTLSLLDEGIAPREALMPILGQMLNFRHSQLIAWEYLKNNWLTIKEMGMGGGELIKAAGNLPYSARKDFVAFCEANVKGVADMSYAQALESIDLYAEFQMRTKDELVVWFDKAE
jgi:puromycin-sensitive aminopeptidase